jgi:hypothetical protein
MNSSWEDAEHCTAWALRRKPETNAKARVLVRVEVSEYVAAHQDSCSPTLQDTGTGTLSGRICMCHLPPPSWLRICTQSHRRYIKSQKYGGEPEATRAMGHAEALVAGCRY